MLSFTHFWRVYFFHLYVYFYLYCIAMICNIFRNLFLSHHHHHYPSPSDWNRAQTTTDVVWAPGNFLHLLFLYIQLTFYLFLDTALLVMMLWPHCHKPLLMGWLMEQYKWDSNHNEWQQQQMTTMMNDKQWMTTTINDNNKTATMQFEHPSLPCSKREMKGLFSSDKSSPALLSSLMSHCSQDGVLSFFFSLILYSSIQ